MLIDQVTTGLLAIPGKKCVKTVNFMKLNEGIPMAAATRRYSDRNRIEVSSTWMSSTSSTLWDARWKVPLPIGIQWHTKTELVIKCVSIFAGEDCITR
jgi:hypothetical protein